MLFEKGKSKETGKTLSKKSNFFWEKSEIYSEILKFAPGLVEATKEIVKKARELGGEVVFLKEDKNSEYYAGFFDKTKLKIFCYFKKENLSWLPVLIHEFNHLIQDANNTDFSRKYFEIFDKNNGAEYKIIDKILKSRRTIEIKRIVGNKENKEMLFRMIDFESECDIMSARMMIDGGFKDLGYVDVEEYIKEANLFLYRVIFLTKTGYWVNLSENEEETEETYKKKDLKIKKDIPGEYLVDSKSEIPKGLEKILEKTVRDEKKRKKTESLKKKILSKRENSKEVISSNNKN